MKAISRISGAVGAVVGTNAMLLIHQHMDLPLPSRILLGGAIGAGTALLLERVLRLKDGGPTDLR